MSDVLNLQFIEVAVQETDQRRGYWLDQPWVSEALRPTLLRAPVLALPNARGGDEGPTFPQGSGEVLDRLRVLLGEPGVVLAIDSGRYMELALHGQAWRLPKLLLTTVVLPMIIGVLTNRLDELLPGHHHDDTLETTFLIEAPHHRTLKIEFKGRVEDLTALLQKQVPGYLERLEEPPMHRPHHRRSPQRGR